MAHRDEQTVLNNDIFSPQIRSKPSLADLMTVETSVSIFYSYARELELSSLFPDKQAKITILAPTNKAVMAAARKPHQGPRPADEEIRMTDEESDRASRENVERWVASHIIPNSPIDLSSAESHPTLLRGKSVSFKPTGTNGPIWSRVTLEDDIKILEMKEASNGVLYVIDGTVTSA